MPERIFRIKRKINIEGESPEEARRALSVERGFSGRELLIGGFVILCFVVFLGLVFNREASKKPEANHMQNKTTQSEEP